MTIFMRRRGRQFRRKRIFYADKKQKGAKLKKTNEKRKTQLAGGWHPSIDSNQPFERRTFGRTKE
jgi:hypothetical protein